MARRERVDPETARLIEARLTALLRDHPPHPPPRVAPLPDVSPAARRPPPGRRVRVDDVGATRARDREVDVGPYAGPDHDPRTSDEDPGSDIAADRVRHTRLLTQPGRRSRGNADDAGGGDKATALRPLPRDRGPTGVGRDPADATLVERALGFTRAHLGVVAVLAILGLLVGGWLVLRARPTAIASPGGVIPSRVESDAPSSRPPSPAATTTPSARAEPTPSGVVVHVLGAVRRPGLVRLAVGARVQDAIRAAGGLRRTADPGELNLAQPVQDGQQIVVGTEDHPAGEVRSGAGGPTVGPDGSTGAAPDRGPPVDLNAATQAQLEELPGVGPVTATKIIAWRTEHGRFSRIEELQEVSGIGPKTYAEIAPHCRV